MGTARIPEKSLESYEPYISQLQGRIAEKESIIITLNEKIQDVAKICSSLELKLKKSEEAKLHIQSESTERGVLLEQIRLEKLDLQQRMKEKEEIELKFGSLESQLYSATKENGILEDKIRKMDESYKLLEENMKDVNELNNKIAELQNSKKCLEDSAISIE